MHLPTEVQELVDAEDCVAAYLSGSTLAELGTPTSDVDVFVIRREAATGLLPTQVLQGGERYDVEVVSVDELVRAVDACLDIEFDFTNIVSIHPLMDDLDQVARLHYSDVLRDDQGVMDQLRSRIAGALPRFRELLVARWALRVNNFQEDFAGFVLCGDDDGSFYSSQTLLTASAKALAASTGAFYLGEKWALRQMRRYNAPLADQVAEQLRGRWQDEPHGAERVLRGVQAMLAAAALQHQGLPVAATVDLGTAAQQGPTRHPLYLPLLTRSGVTMNWERQHQVNLKGGLLAVWLACDGVDKDTAWKRVSDWFGSVGREFERSRFDLAVEALSAQGLLVEPAAVGFLSQERPEVA